MFSLVWEYGDHVRIIVGLAAFVVVMLCLFALPFVIVGVRK